MFSKHEERMKWKWGLREVYDPEQNQQNRLIMNRSVIILKSDIKHKSVSCSQTSGDACLLMRVGIFHSDDVSFTRGLCCSSGAFVGFSSSFLLLSATFSAKPNHLSLIFCITGIFLFNPSTRFYCKKKKCK